MRQSDTDNTGLKVDLDININLLTRVNEYEIWIVETSMGGDVLAWNETVDRMIPGQEIESIGPSPIHIGSYFTLHSSL